MGDLLDAHEWWCAGGAPGHEEDEPCAGSGCDVLRSVGRDGEGEWWRGQVEDQGDIFGDARL